MQKLFLFACFLVSSIVLNAQASKIDPVYDSTALRNIREFYNSERGVESAIYNGRLHYPYASVIEGTAYFHSADWQKGNVIYDNIFYENILMKYDLVADQVIVIANEMTGTSITLFSPRIKAFSFSGFRFVYLNENKNKSFVPAGFYHLLAEGRINALSKTTRIITEKIEAGQINRKFEEKKAYYILKGGQYYSIKNKSELLNTLREHNKAIQNLLKTMRLNYRKNPMQTIIAAVEFYNRQPD
ncbi:MAG TPA: hypothetical protein VFH08_03315 [Chitinophagaceae bacterium]|nr:hypothetical protein [Chitinophagaceae bacterium]